MKDIKNIKKLESMCEHISKMELLASKAERDSIKYKQGEYLQDKIGQVFDGVVSGITDWGIYVEIIDNKCEGMIRYKSLGDNYRPDLDLFSVKNDLGEVIRLGDLIKIVISSIDLERKQIDFKKF